MLKIDETLAKIFLLSARNLNLSERGDLGPSVVIAPYKNVSQIALTLHKGYFQLGGTGLYLQLFCHIP
jgi:hypothetical protein